MALQGFSLVFFKGIVCTCFKSQFSAKEFESASALFEMKKCSTKAGQIPKGPEGCLNGTSIVSPVIFET